MSRTGGWNFPGTKVGFFVVGVRRGDFFFETGAINDSLFSTRLANMLSTGDWRMRSSIEASSPSSFATSIAVEIDSVSDEIDSSYSFEGFVAICTRRGVVLRTALLGVREPSSSARQRKDRQYRSVGIRSPLTAHGVEFLGELNGTFAFSWNETLGKCRKP